MVGEEKMVVTKVGTADSARTAGVPSRSVGKLLVVDDDPEVRGMLSRLLEVEGYKVTEAVTGAEAIGSLANGQPDLVILDVMLTTEDGFDVLAAIRRTSDVPVILVTAKNHETDRVLGLKLGADDYVVKPVSNAVLVRRVRAALRHVREPRAPAFDQVYEFSGVTIDLNRAALIGTTDGVAHQVSPIERKLLARLLASPGLAVPEAELLRAGWGVAAQWAEAAPEDGVETNVLRLRKKLALAQPGCEGLIFNVRGEGYGIQPPLRVHPAQDDPPPAARRD